MQSKRKVLCREGLLGELSGATLLFDSTAFIDAFRYPVFMEFLAEIAESGCSLVTIPSVIYEFKRGAKNFDQVNSFNNFIEELNIGTINHVENMSQKKDNQIFTMLYNFEAFNGRKEKGPSYTDSLLCLILYMYRHVDIRLLTTNYRDVPLSLFDRTDILAFDTGREVRTTAIYKLSMKKLAKKLQTMQP